MSINDRNLVFRILNVWLAVVLILIIASHLPHWPNISIHSWLNSAFYFLLFLLTLTIAVKEKNNRDIFLNLSIYLFVYFFSLLNIFLGDGYLFGGDHLKYYYFHYKKMAFSFLLNLVIIYPVVKYFFTQSKKMIIYCIFLVLAVPIFLLTFHSIIFKPLLIYELRETYYSEIYRRILLNNLPAFAIISFYGYQLYKKDKILGEYINLLMACLFIILVTGLFSNLSEIYGFEIFNIGQYVLTLNLIVMCTILFKKLFFINSEFGQFYEDLISKRIQFDQVKIKRHRSERNAFLLKVLKLYLIQRRNYIFTLFLLGAIICGYFNFPRYFTLSSIVILLCIIILFWFANALYKKRAKQQYIIQ